MKSLVETIWLKITAMTPRSLLAICLLGVFAAFTLNLVNVQYTRDYTSDNVANQYILQSMDGKQSDHGVFPIDSFFLHFPLYAATDLVMPNNTQTKLFIQAFVLSVASLAAIVITLLYYLKKLGLYSKTSILIGSLLLGFILSTPLFAEYALEINHRLFEASLALLLFIPLHYYLSLAKTIQLKRLVPYAAVYALLLGSVWFSDPYFTYVMAGGIAITLYLLWLQNKLSWKKLLVVASTILAALIVTKIYGLLFERLDLFLIPNGKSTIIQVTELFANTQNTIGSFFANFDGNVFGIDPLETSKQLLLTLASGFVLALFAAYALLQATKSSVRNVMVLRSLFAATALSLLVFLTLTPGGSTPFTEDLNGRYLLFIPLLLLPLMTEHLVDIYKQNRKLGQTLIVIISAGLCIMTALNTYGTGLGLTGRKDIRGNELHYGVITILENAGYAKGYADYWQGPINTYLSNNRIHSMQTSCTNGVLSPYHWLVNDGDFTIKAQKTFYILDPSRTDPSTCSVQKLSQHYGKPERVIQHQDLSILLYNRDILAQ